MNQVPLYVPQGKGESLWVVEDLTVILLEGAQTGGAFSLFDIHVSPGKGVPPHYHEREDETFVVTEGELTFWVDGKTLTAGAGDVLYAPRGVPHQFTNTSNAPARLYVFVSPSGLEQFFRAIGDPVKDPDSPPPATDVARLTAGCEAHGIHLLPPA